ncbi:hypothetical protein OQX61_17530 [Pedobacter sp. PLR]|uniref:glycosyltransferase family 2 protein n=1 Tax=Pedobacter sp. PLR TaxID=2994465 RepID=UPI0022477348|nr:hypothetical protein [Pedobacter sp. PLR]MCX2453082.1 hypothetical protein [Pedobacter sp. PLR]
MIFFLYIVLVFLVLRFSVTLFNFVSNPKIGNYRRSFTDKVVIIIKIRQTAQEAEKLMASVAAQDYQNYEILIQSADGPDVAASAKGAYFLFLDANTQIEKGLINSLVYRTTVFKLALLSVIPTPKISGFLANCIYPLSDFVLLNLFPLRLVRLINHPAFAMANGACLFFDAAVYQRYEWNDRVKDSSQEALEMVKTIKQEKLKADLLLGNKLIYQEERELDLTLFSKRLMLNFSNQPIVALGYLVLVIAGPVVMALTLAPVFLLLPYGLIFLSRMMIAYLSAQKPFPNILYHPLQMLSLTWLLLNNSWNRFLAVLKPKK